MVQAGGPAAINGFLYQILKHLHWLASARIEGQVSGSDVAGDARIILEPKDGGDARLQGKSLYLVEQYKTCSDGTWSVQSIIEDVLPDLRLAVPEPLPSEAEYRFVTNGREGQLGSFRKFLEAVQKVNRPEDLDSTSKHHFGKKLPPTFRELFEYILSKTKRNAERQRTDAAASVLHLLKRFQMDFDVSAKNTAEQIDDWLRPMCANVGAEVGKRRQLIGTLMEQLSGGEAEIPVDAVDRFLTVAGLNPESAHRISQLNQLSRSILDRECAVVGYNAKLDVRRPPAWPTEKPVLVVTAGGLGAKDGSGSGEGKTWQLLASLRASAQASRSVAWVRWEKGCGTDDILNKAANVIWQECLGFADTRTILGLTNWYRDRAPSAAMPWLTIAIDNVQDKEVGRELASRRWEDWGVCLAMSVPPDVAAVLANQPVDRVHVQSLDRFSVTEIDNLLSHYGRRWVDLPSDLQKLVRIPILAGLYIQLPFENFETAPHSEYEIFHRFWKRMIQRGETGDEGILTNLAHRVVDQATYPVPKSDWHLIGLDTHSLQRLRAAGWLVSLPGGFVEFAHDRLLNWAVAVEVALSFEYRTRSADEIGDLLLKCAAHEHTRRLGYVPMDALWLMAKEALTADNLARVIGRLGESQHYGSYGENLYTYLLPTLGQCIVPALEARLSNLPEGDYQIRLIAQALSTIARQESADLSELTGQLLRSGSGARQSVGIALASAKPSGDYLNRLWDMHQERCTYADKKTWEEREQCPWDHRDYEASFAALQACVAVAPNWLQQRIKLADPKQERVSELGYLLNNLEHPSASDIWSEVKSDLVHKISKDKPRSLLYCIGRFRDHTLMSFLVSCLPRNEDLANSAALANLIRLDPEQAIACLADFPTSELAMARNWWLPYLLEIKPIEVRRRILEMAGNDPKGRRLLDDLFADRSDYVDDQLLRFHLRAFEEELRQRLEMTCKEDTFWPFFPLRLLNNISRPDLLAVLRDEAGGELERMVADVACSRISGRSNHHDGVLEGCRQFLIRVGGKGITRLLNHELSASEYWGRFGGLEWAFVAPDTETISLLGSISRRPVSVNEDGKQNSEDWFERYRATITLASAGSDKEVIESIWGEGPEAISADLDEIRGAGNPLAGGLSGRALEVLGDSNAPDAQVMKALSIAWLAKDVEILSAIRAVLRRVTPDSDVARMACFVLAELGDTSPDFLRLALPMLKTGNRLRAMNALLSMGGAAEEHLLAHLEDVPFSNWTSEDVSLAQVLCNRESTRDKAIKWAVRLCHERKGLIPPYFLGVRSGDARVRELITEVAFGEDSFVVGNKTEAIKALFEFDPNLAIAAAEKQLRITRSELWLLTKQLAQMTPKDAAERLIKVARLRKDSLTAVGQAMRRIDAEQVDRMLLACMSDPSRDVRSVGAKLAGWQSPERLIGPLKSMLEQEAEPDVRDAVLEALGRKRQQQTALDLLQAFDGVSDQERWTLLLALLEVADPHLLNDRNDPLWIGAVLDNAPYIFWHFAEEELRKRISKAE
ncbi:HEAT repeat domain-containing protein [Azospirillum sp. A23]|uniref:HEAT repeat domain-containing protein n=1 Tax=Azospirillum sp. A23 TaxID=3160608 RepID=UPI0036F2ABA7